MKNVETVYHNLRYRMKKKMEVKNLTVRELSELSGVHVTTLYDIFSKEKFPRLDTIVLVANALGCTPAYLIMDDEETETIMKWGIQLYKKRLNYLYGKFGVKHQKEVH